VDKHLDGRKHAVIVGSGPRALALYSALTGEGPGKYEILGFVDSKSAHGVPPEVRARMLGPIEALESILVRSPVDRVLITLPVRSCYADIQKTIRICERVGVESHYLSDLFALSVAKQRYHNDERFPFVTLHVVSDDARLIVKRAIDVLGAITGLVLFAPILAVCALLVKFTSPGPVLFSQERYGLNRRLFRMLKFRTMVHDAEARQNDLESFNESRGPVFKIRRDPRLTPLGWFLRKSSIDELPQLLNILKGEMSIVGPRPVQTSETQRYGTDFPFYSACRPGVVGLWQVSGRNKLTYAQRVAYDIEYVQTWTIWADVVILARAVPVVLLRDGAY
jgi:exopolysaccharide biosynthesis polyprenyl glycosylphosphotransferase